MPDATHWETAFLAGMVRTPAIKAMMASSASGRYACRHGLIFNPTMINTMPTTFTFDSLMQAARECAKGVRWKTSVASWVHPCNLASNCLKLLDELETGEYRLSPYSVFRITSPKPRVIMAPKFRDRVVQRAACNLGLYDDLTRDNIYDNGACQRKKGTTFTMNRLVCHLQRFWRKHGTNGWVLRLDIRKFFDSIPHDRLKAMVHEKVGNPEFDWICSEVIDSFADPGIGLGSQLSQLLAISYLSDFDHYVKEQLDIRHYIRYSDDIVMVHEHRDTLSDAWRQMRECLCDEKDLDLNDKKCSLLPLPDGVRFMKFLFRLTKTGKVVRTLDRSNITHARRRLRRLVAMVNNGDRMPEDAINSFNSWKAHASHGNSYHIIRRMQTCLQPIQFCRPTPCVNNVSP